MSNEERNLGAEHKVTETVGRAFSDGRYMITVTSIDPEKQEGNLSHSVFRENFPLDDIVPSLDACVRSMGIFVPPTVSITEPPIPLDDSRKFKVMLTSHFNRFPDSYSPGRALRHFAKTLLDHGHEVSYLGTEGSTADIGCPLIPALPRFKRQKGVVDEAAKGKIISAYREHLQGYDMCVTFDFFIQDTVTFREAIKECGVKIAWAHWARSGVGEQMDFDMVNAVYLHLNKADVGVFAKRIGVPEEKVRVVMNEKDPEKFFGWSPVTGHVSRKMRLWEKDVVSVQPICTTRFDAKSLDSVMSVFSALKSAGKNVALIVANSNGRKRPEDVARKLEVAKGLGLADGEDILFTSTLEPEWETASGFPNKAVGELMQMSNLMVLASKAEAGPQMLLEAAIAGNLLVVNSDLKLNYDFVSPSDIIEWPFTSNREMHFSSRTPSDFGRLARKIIGELDSNKADRQRRRTWREHNSETVYRKQIYPVLHELASRTETLRK